MGDGRLAGSFYGGAPRLALIRAGAGEAILFLHGLGSTKENWDDQLAYFATSHFVAAWDARGYGESADYEDDLVFDRDFVADLLGVLDQLHVARAHLVGLSMGGLIAQCFYFAHPERVATLVLADTFPSFGALGADTVARFTAARLQPLLDGAEPADMATGALTSLIAADARTEARTKLLASLSGLRRESYIKSIRALLAQGAPGELERIAVPTLVVVGELDALSPVDVSRRMAARIPASRLSVIAGAGHMSNLEKPAEFNALLQAFLADHAGAATEVRSR